MTGGNTVTKANADMELAIDSLIQSDKLDHIYLVTGDGDFCRLVRALQDKGCRLHVIGFQNVSRDLRRAADFFMSGFLIPRPATNRRWCNLGGDRITSERELAILPSNFRFHQGPVEDEADKGVWVLDWNPEDIVRNKGTLEAVPSLI